MTRTLLVTDGTREVTVFYSIASKSFQNWLQEVLADAFGYLYLGHVALVHSGSGLKLVFETPTGFDAWWKHHVEILEQRPMSLEYGSQLLNHLFSVESKGV